MNSKKFILLATLLFVILQMPFAAIRTVSKDGSGQYSTISAALDDAQEGDEVIILDFETYREQVTINKNRITLRSQTPALSKKPTILYQDKINVGPTTGAESKIEEKITFDQNGAMRVMRAQGVIIDGIILDGGGAAPFAYSGIWNDKDPLFHGNSALTLFIAGDVTVRNCELQNAYFGIYIKDRNEGGIYIIHNPADWEREVPLSGFEKTGNHILESNRIHNNSWGIFFESTWNLGSIIRYNLIYENHHTSSLGPLVKAMADGGNQPGGAFLFKDMILSPVAIYNNTFWKNHALFAAHWKAGSQHLIFNNIYAEPYIYWPNNPDFPNPFMEYTANFVNRMKNSLFAVQNGSIIIQTENYQWSMIDPATNLEVTAQTQYTFIPRVTIMDSMDVSEKQGLDIPITLHLSTGDTTKYFHESRAILPGARIIGKNAIKPYSNGANVRWLEPKFQSTDPAAPGFLTPDWNDPVMKQFIVDQGWPEAGIRDADGSIADIGAIPYTKRQEENIVIKPKGPISVLGTTATATFNLSVLSGKFNNPVIQYIKWIDLPTFRGTEFGPNATKLVPGTHISPVTPSISTIQEGLNKFTFTVSARTKTKEFGFLEMVVKGTNATGDTVTSNVGFLPYRTLSYNFIIKIKDKAGTNELKEVRVGDTVQMVVIPTDMSGEVLNVPIDTAETSLASNYMLFNNDMKQFTFKRGFTITDSVNYVVFQKVPPEGALEYVYASGKFLTSKTDSVGNTIRGTSEGIKILPGPADHVLFYDPPSKGIKLVYPGLSAVVTAKVYDKFGNLIDKSNSGEKTVTLKSSNPEIGDVDGNLTATIDDTGAVTFKLKATGGDKSQTFPIITTLPIKGTSDTATGKIGAPRDRFFIFYSDTIGGYVESAKIEGFCGDRYPVTIIATNNGLDILTGRTDTPFNIDFPGNTGVLNAYSSPNDSVPIMQYHLTNGKAKIWITSTRNSISNGEIDIYSFTDHTIVNNARKNIFFVKSPGGTAVKSASYISTASYYDNDADGIVDNLKIEFDQDIVKEKINVYTSWTGGNLSSKTLINPVGINYGLTERDILVNLSGKNSTVLKNVTSGKFDVTVKNIGSTDQMNKTASDKAAPVIISADYYPSELGITNSQDTLKINFSESVISVFDPESFVFYSNSSVYKVKLKNLLNLSGNKNLNTYLIDTVIRAGFSTPAFGDSVNVKIGVFADSCNNYQDNPHNKKIAIKIHPVKIKMKMKLGPNPFEPVKGQFMTIEIAPENSNNSVLLSGKFKIFDCMGNVVKMQNIDKSTGKIRMCWDGKNTDGRIVGAGTYCMELNIVNQNANNDLQLGLPEHIMIGVKR